MPAASAVLREVAALEAAASASRTKRAEAVGLLAHVLQRVHGRHVAVVEADIQRYTRDLTALLGTYLPRFAEAKADALPLALAGFGREMTKLAEHYTPLAANAGYARAIRDLSHRGWTKPPQAPIVAPLWVSQALLAENDAYIDGLLRAMQTKIGAIQVAAQGEGSAALAIEQSFGARIASYGSSLWRAAEQGYQRCLQQFQAARAAHPGTIKVVESVREGGAGKMRESIRLTEIGGPGSGNKGHYGIQGKQGGSLPTVSGATKQVANLAHGLSATQNSPTLTTGAYQVLVTHFAKNPLSSPEINAAMATYEKANGLPLTKPATAGVVDDGGAEIEKLAAVTTTATHSDALPLSVYDDALTPADNLERLRGAANDVIRTNLIAKMPFETRQANDAAAVKSLTPYYSGWMSSSDTRSGIALRLAANQLNGVPLARGLKPDNIHMISSNWRLDGAGPMQYDRPAGTDRLSEHVALTQGLRSTYNLNKASWDAEFGAAGHDVYRGIGKSEFRAAFGGDLPPAGARASFQPLQSVSDLKSVTKGFNNGAIIKFAGVRGDDVLVSHRYHAGPWHNGGGEKESIMFGNKHDWTVTHTAPGDADSGFVPVITMERAKE